MNDNRLEITSQTKVAELLEHFPELEETLIAMAPPFKKLRNPVLRRSVAKVASLRQAAAVGSLPIDKMVNALRSVVGQTPIESEEGTQSEDYYGHRPDWFDESLIASSADEAQDIPENQMPVTVILQRANALTPGEIFEFRATFLPVPGIDLLRAKGFLSWSVECADNDIRTYFAKPR